MSTMAKANIEASVLKLTYADVVSGRVLKLTYADVVSGRVLKLTYADVVSGTWCPYPRLKKIVDPTEFKEPEPEKDEKGKKRVEPEPSSKDEKEPGQSSKDEKEPETKKTKGTGTERDLIVLD